MVDFVPVYRLSPGQTARIARLEGDPRHVHRLNEFGLHLGTPIQMFRPGNPCIIRMAGSKICLRADRSLNVLVKPADAL